MNRARPMAARLKTEKKTIVVTNKGKFIIEGGC